MSGNKPPSDLSADLARVAHEFNNALTVINGSLVLAQRHAANNPVLERLLEHIGTAAKRAEALTRRVAELAGPDIERTLYQPPPQPLPDQAPSRCVLVVEDDPNVAAVAVAVLESLGLQVELADSGPMALARLQSMQRVDLVFSDIVMPGGMSGIELAQKLEATRPEIPVLLATGFSREALGTNALRFPVLPKPYSVAELSRRVQQMIGA